MRISTSLFLLYLFEQELVSAFVLPAPTRTQQALRVDASPEGTPRTKPMSPAEIKARMLEKQGLPPDDDESPKLFSESLYEDMQQTLLTLEKRIKGGPGSLSMLEVEEMMGQTQRILVEMEDFDAQPEVIDVAVADVPAAVAPPAVPKAPPAAVAVAPVAPPASVPAPVEVSAAALAAAAAASETADEEVSEYSSSDEGPAYDGQGGMGMPKGTRNTYVIPGMDSMSPEEYQAALQKSLIDRQTERQKGGKYGNLATWDYLNNLTGESGVLKHNEEAP